MLLWPLHLGKLLVLQVELARCRDTICSILPSGTVSLFACYASIVPLYNGKVSLLYSKTVVQYHLVFVWEQEPTLHRKCRAGSERAVTEY